MPRHIINELKKRVIKEQRVVPDDASCGTLYADCGAGQALQVAAAEVGTVRCKPVDVQIVDVQILARTNAPPAASPRSLGRAGFPQPLR